jgi:formylglycine-generating enzyme required for sulfatase activity/serine/threonine protein kinase
MRFSTGQILHNRYRVENMLAQGGFGILYRAWDIALDRPCVLKENLDISSEAQRQFTREAKILANLSHSNLPRVTDFFSISGQGQYLVMDLVEGEDLQEMLEKRGSPLSEDQALAWIGQVCDALSYLHSQNPPIIHRDIKPANIRITTDTPAYPSGRIPGQAVLVDFGIAKVFDPGLKTTIGARAVTPGYSPVEQYGKGVTDARTDVYALGATLYTLLTGEEAPESVQRAVRDTMVPPQKLNPGLSQATAEIILRAVEVDPERRYQSMEEFKKALKFGPPARFGGRVSPVPAGRSPHSPSSSTAAPRLAASRWFVAAGFLAVVLLLIVVLINGINVRGDMRSTQTAMAALSAIPSRAVAGAESPTRSLPIPTPTPPPEPTPIVYKVQTGDTCGNIAASFGVSIQSIITLNSLDAECLITDGQNLLVRVPPRPTPASPEATAPLEITIESRVSAVDGMEMVFVPRGAFLRGSTDEDSQAAADEKPQRWIYLDDFWIDRTEITNGMYARCVQRGGCQAPDKTISKTRLVYFGDSRYADYPVIYVSWEDARAYCRWAGRRLPTEAEWEKAARGADGRAYPWGNDRPNASLVNYNNQIGDTVPVGSYAQGASPYGALDMAGNVAEWVADWYSQDYYAVAPADNPTGPSSGEYRVLRGGSWFNLAHAVRGAFRLWNYPVVHFEGGGFRCASSG